MRTVTTTPAATTPVALAEVRSWLNMEPSIRTDDLVLEQLIDETIDYLQQQTNRYILTQTATVYLDSDEIQSEIHLPCVPLVSVSSVKTTTDAGVESTVTSTNYQVRAGENPRITLTQSGAWPTDVRDYDGMAVACVMGYDGDVIPYVGFKPTNQTTTQLDDLLVSGTFTGTVRTTYEIKIDSAGTPDVMKFRKITKNAYGVKTTTAWSSGVNITGAAQLIGDGLSVTFGATTGHTDESQWAVELYEVLPPRIRMLFKALMMQFYLTKGRGTTETVSGQVIGIPYHIQAQIESLRLCPWV